jgi:hypothetical protein
VTQAWAEVQHNIIYKKPTEIHATPSMRRITDAIDGLAINTEIMLKELERSYEQAREEAEARDRKPFSPSSEIQRWFYKTYLMKMPREERERWVCHWSSAVKFDNLWSNTHLSRRMGTVHHVILCPKNLRKLIETLGILRLRAGNGQLDLFVMLLEGMGHTPGEKPLGQNFLHLVETEGLVTTASDKRFNFGLFNSGSHLI